MSVEFVTGDMFATNGLTHICHGVNLCGAFGAGIAGQIARSRPWARLDYLSWYYRAELGQIKISKAPTFIPEFSKIPSAEASIVHMATQVMPGSDARLDAVQECVQHLRDELRDLDDDNWVIAIPQLGCGIGGLEWSDVQPVLKRAFSSIGGKVLVFENYKQGKAVNVQ